jgi:uncharacterized protein (TIGR03083 family)
MESKEQLIRELVEARRAFEAAMAAVGTEAEVYPGWTLKELLAHIAGWDDVVLDMVRAHALDQAPRPLEAKSIQAYNEMSVEARRALSYDQALAEFQETRAKVLEALEGMPEDRVGAPLQYPWGGTGALAEMVAIFTEHEEEHTETLQGMSSQ